MDVHAHAGGDVQQPGDGAEKGGGFRRGAVQDGHSTPGDLGVLPHALHAREHAVRPPPAVMGTSTHRQIRRSVLYVLRGRGRRCPTRQRRNHHRHRRTRMHSRSGPRSPGARRGRPPPRTARRGRPAPGRTRRSAPARRSRTASTARARGAGSAASGGPGPARRRGSHGPRGRTGPRPVPAAPRPPRPARSRVRGGPHGTGRRCPATSPWCRPRRCRGTRRRHRQGQGGRAPWPPGGTRSACGSYCGSYPVTCADLHAQRSVLHRFRSAHRRRISAASEGVWSR
ncbi:hypothetical protein ACFFX0_09280 [Citricoccus parietis]|uniref:Uncharacterized protein n=1 Tax=Citricoccus parietis TaxID=592307 RepID=A0ABV5FXG4_9MICC